MLTPRTIIALLLITLALYLAVMNWLAMVVSVRNRRKGISKRHSTVPIVSALVALVAFAVYPHSPKWWIVIIPLVDLSNWNMLRVPFRLMANRRKKNSDPGADG